MANVPRLDDLIREVRGQKVILDTDLARIYDIPTFRFNEAIKRNRARFPDNFMFRLTPAEFAALTSQFAITKPRNSSQIAMSFEDKLELTDETKAKLDRSRREIASQSQR